MFQKGSTSGADNSKLVLFTSVKEPILKPGDKVTFSIWGHEELSVGSINTNFNSNEASGKWLIVSDNGEVNLPKLGRTNIGGLTIREVNYKLEELYGVQIKNPIINIRVLNHYVTILGEVKQPGKYRLNNDGMNIVQLIGEAQGLADYAQKEAVEIIRNIDGENVKLSIDLTDIVSLEKFNFNLQPNDIVYISPEKRKAWHHKVEKATPIASILTGVAVIFSVFFK